MAMKEAEIISPRRKRSGSAAHADFSAKEAHGPVIDQDGREIPQGDRPFEGFQFDLAARRSRR